MASLTSREATLYRTMQISSVDIVQFRRRNRVFGLALQSACHPNHALCKEKRKYILKKTIKNIYVS
jgi:hypothetical protein